MTWLKITDKITLTNTTQVLLYSQFKYTVVRCGFKNQLKLHICEWSQFGFWDLSRSNLWEKKSGMRFAKLYQNLFLWSIFSLKTVDPKLRFLCISTSEWVLRLVDVEFHPNPKFISSPTNQKTHLTLLFSLILHSNKVTWKISK